MRLIAAIALLASLSACSLPEGSTGGGDEDPSNTTHTTRPIAAPGDIGVVVVSADDDLQDVVDSNPPGTVFQLLAGRYMGQQVTPSNGQRFIGDPGSVMDGMGSTEFAFHGDSRDVTIEGLVIEHYANPPQRGAIDGGGVGWTVTGNEIRNNLGAGVVLDSNFTIADNFIHHNEQIGVLARGSGGRLVDNEISFNNPNDRYDPAWEAGGTKFILTNDLYVSGNYVHDNHGPGLWTDHQNSGTLYEDNVVSDNYGPGIMHEVSYDAVIRDNQVTGNAYEFYVGGILVSSSPNVLVYDNMVVDNNGGIAAVQDDRGSGNSGVFELTDLNVSENRVSYETGWGGVRVNNGADVTKWGIVFSNNSYSFSPLSSRPFFWGDERLSLEQWRAIGFDDPNGP